VEWKDEPGSSIIIGEHDGYTRLPDSVVHRRKLTLCKRDGSLAIFDRFSSKSSHEIRRYFHLAPDCDVDKIDENSIQIRSQGVEIVLRHDSSSAAVVHGDEQSQLGWVSSGYHKRSPTHAIVLTDDLGSNSESDLTVTMAVTCS
jgi:hypothetical protein